MKKRTLIVAAVLMTAAFLPANEPNGEPEASRPVRIEAFEGLIEANRILKLGSSVDGVISEVRVERGDLVKAGDVIAQLDTRVEKAEVALAKARAESEGALKKRKARLAFGRSKYKNDLELHRTGILSDELLDQSRTELALAEAEFIEAEETAQLAQLAYKQALAALELRTIRSPVDAVVVERYLSPGETVTRQSQSHIVQLAQVDPLKVEIILPALMFGNVKAGDRATVRTQFEPNRSYPAEVVQVDRVVDAASGTFRVRLRMDNPNNEVPSGLKCSVLLD